MTESLVSPGLPSVAPVVVKAAREARDADILRRWDAGESTYALGHRYGVHASRISQIARANGRPKRSGGWVPDHVAKRAAEKGAALGKRRLSAPELVSLGWTYGEAAARLGTTRNAIAGAVHRAKQRASA